MVKLDHTGLRHHFDEVVCSHDFGAPKESAAFWERFLARHPFDAGHSLFVDDNLSVLRAARSFGVGQLVAVRKPESNGPLRDTGEFAGVDAIVDLLPIG
jgi:putative hydrolase of the HAD superfamily